MSKALAFNSALVNQLIKPMVIRPIAWDERVTFTIDYQFPFIFLRRRRIDLLTDMILLLDRFHEPGRL